MIYVKPEEVKSPKKRWHLIEILKEGKEGECSYALGEWDGERTIGVRWNGSKESPLGNPQSRGLATWFILDASLHKGVISLLKDKKKKRIANTFLELI